MTGSAAGLPIVMMPAASDASGGILTLFSTTLCVYALMSFLLQVWSGTRERTAMIGWLSAAVVVIAGVDLGRAAGLVPGKFAIADLWAATLACIGAAVRAYRQLTREMQ